MVKIITPHLEQLKRLLNRPTKMSSKTTSYSKFDCVAVNKTWRHTTVEPRRPFSAQVLKLQYSKL